MFSNCYKGASLVGDGGKAGGCACVGTEAI